MVFTF
jgi:hypothetical protein